MLKRKIERACLICFGIFISTLFASIGIVPTLILICSFINATMTGRAISIVILVLLDIFSISMVTSVISGIKEHLSYIGK